MGEKFKDGELIIRDATVHDMHAVIGMIQELADFEKMPDGPKLTVEDLQRDGFELEPPAFKCKVAEIPFPSEVIGYALYFPTYSTWEGKAIMLEDLYVCQKYRRRGVGNALFTATVLQAVKMGCNRVDFHVLAWNQARKFYEAIGAKNLTESEQWCYYRLSGDALALASSKTKLHSA
ncbi:Diamine acetyltransferase 2 [Papilio xuthus]|uniref:Diamine acetyltransferase 2 n=1 Tax=Papilio xuthus TaxID=66420 RepID=A0A194Q1F4_PAPXU|nr:Diamine acetyltransferase 2 [Papilio xuthus]